MLAFSGDRSVRWLIRPIDINWPYHEIFSQLVDRNSRRNVASTVLIFYQDNGYDDPLYYLPPNKEIIHKSFCGRLYNLWFGLLCDQCYFRSRRSTGYLLAFNSHSGRLYSIATEIPTWSHWNLQILRSSLTRRSATESVFVPSGSCIVHVVFPQQARQPPLRVDRFYSAVLCKCWYFPSWIIALTFFLLYTSNLFTSLSNPRR